MATDSPTRQYVEKVRTFASLFEQALNRASTTAAFDLLGAIMGHVDSWTGTLQTICDDDTEQISKEASEMKKNRDTLTRFVIARELLFSGDREQGS